jgi:hypothetical protein
MLLHQFAKHRTTKPGSLQDSSSSINGSDDDSESKSSSQSNSSSSTEDSENGKLNDEDLMNEVSQMFTILPQ